MEEKGKNTKKYDLDERCLTFAKNTRDFVGKLKPTAANREYAKQLLRSSSAIGANYIEANDSLGKKDFVMRLRIARKEAKETCYWLSLVETDNKLGADAKFLLQEADELTMILSSILRKF